MFQVFQTREREREKERYIEREIQRNINLTKHVNMYLVTKSI